MYYLVKIQYYTAQEGGDKLKKKKEAFMVDAVSVTDAEAKVTNWIPANWQDAKLDDVNKSPIVDINWGEGEEVWFKAKVAYLDGEEKTKPFQVLVEATDITRAINKLERLYTASWISEISESKIVLDSDLTETENVTRLTPDSESDSED